ncbi:hypothetical protein [Acinetobacter guerrae]|uniref:hypothetical protein n=1 Tax=Acinetobacter guerrae TaxID=1843371 RepID=UPI00125FCB45|nr:hypothetical protein [Acinetobacter guerrae]
MSTHFSRLKLIIQDPLKFKDLNYKFIVSNNHTKKATVFDGHFNGQGLTEWTEIYNLNTTLIYEIYLGGELLQKVAAKAYPNKNKHNVFTVKTTTEITKNIKENIKEIYLNDGEVAWYLIKNTETMLNWSKKVFKRPLIPSDWDILKANNTHISDIAPIKLLTPGMVVILSNSTTAKALPKYKKYAQEAQKNLDEMQKDKNFDAVFFAQNYEFFYDAMLNKNSKISHQNILENNNDPLVLKFDQHSNDSTAAWGSVLKGGIDGALSFSDGIVQRMHKIHGELALKMAEEKAKGSSLANPKNFKAFKNKYSYLYDELNRESLKQIFKWDRSIKTDNMRRIISQSTLARGEIYKDGIKEYVKKMSELGKMSKYIKGGGYLFLALDVYNARDAIVHAKNEEKAKTIVVETSKIAGGIGGASLGAFIVLTVASGGTSLIVLGLAARASALLGWGFSEGAGIIADKSYIFFES